MFCYAKLGRYRGVADIEQALTPFNLAEATTSEMVSMKWRLKLTRRVRNLGVPANMFDTMRMVFRA